MSIPNNLKLVLINGSRPNYNSRTLSFNIVGMQALSQNIISSINFKFIWCTLCKQAVR